MFIYPNNYDVIVVGAGHAGCEAALATARLGLSTLLLTINLDTIAQMSCNTCIGGVAKGQIVREIDALGGEMGKIADRSGLQFRMLNSGKGPAVRSPRAQCDKKLYQFTMKSVLEKQPNLDLRQDEAVELVITGNRVAGIITRGQVKYSSKAVIITTGTFLKGLIHIGETTYKSGRSGEFSAEHLSASLAGLGFEIRRLKTGTPPRINSKNIDFSKLEEQRSDKVPAPFSHFTKSINQKLLPCWLTYTNEKTHRIIAENFDRAPLFSGQIKGIGPRYCPSIEDKVKKFPSKLRHQVFLEPEGYDTNEIYCNGLATSLPIDVQYLMLRTISGLENAQIMRPGYAIEYDFCPPTQLKPNLETKLIENLFFAGQINGTSGYEEAAGQGIVAGINACLKLKGREPFILDRSEAYIGVLIDDLVTKGVLDPYRMFTSRAEYRLMLRSDNADLRLLEYGCGFGLISGRDHERFLSYRKHLGQISESLEKEPAEPGKQPFAVLIRQGKLSEEGLIESYPEAAEAPPGPQEQSVEDGYVTSMKRVLTEAFIEIKYAGYIKRQNAEIKKFKNLENKRIPAGLDYEAIPSLLTESRHKLASIKPASIGQASRISGVTPADINILLIHLERYKKPPLA